MNSINRRTFLEFLGLGAASAFGLGCIPPRQISKNAFNLKGILPSAEDRIVLAEGLHHELLIRWDDPISASERFGFNNDFLTFLPLDKNNPNDGLLWANHEYPDPVFVSGYSGEGKKSKAQIEKEMYSVGGSIVHIRKSANGKWEVVQNDPHNRRLTGQTKIPFNWHEPVGDSNFAIGTLGNCAGGITPWGTILTAEENYKYFYGERDLNSGDHIPGLAKDSYYWYEHFPENKPEHYGWIVEVNPRTGEAQKHIALGRCAHECATVVELPDGRIVVYSGDDANFQCVYKFISSEPGSLSKGTLYVADTENGKWLPLDLATSTVLQGKFKSQTQVLIHLREAAHLVGGSKLDRPEDIEIHPHHPGWVLVTLTNNIKKQDYTGSILKIMETDGRHDSLTFTSVPYLTGGPETGFACPDNLAFDPAGNLWFTSDISGEWMNNPKYPSLLDMKNNGLFVVPAKGPDAGKVIQWASAPVGAEFTGPWFAPDGETLFLSVQHPGEYGLPSDWPGKDGSIPRPAVIAIFGELLVSLTKS